MPTDIALLDRDPSELGFPPSLPMELAARMGPVKDICQNYGISKDEWAMLRLNPVFQQACDEALKLIASEGGTFKIKARTIAESLLPRLHKLATATSFDDVPASVQASLITTAIRVAGLDASIDQKGAAAGKAAGAIAPLQIQINLR